MIETMGRPKLDLREGLPEGVDPFAVGSMLLLTPGGKYCRALQGPAYVYLMVACPGCGEVRARIFAPKLEWTVTCRLCGWREDDDQFHEPSFSE